MKALHKIYILKDFFRKKHTFECVVDESWIFIGAAIVAAIFSFKAVISKNRSFSPKLCSMHLAPFLRSTFLVGEKHFT